MLLQSQTHSISSSGRGTFSAVPLLQKQVNYLKHHPSTCILNTLGNKAQLCTSLSLSFLVFSSFCRLRRVLRVSSALFLFIDTSCCCTGLLGARDCAFEGFLLCSVLFVSILSSHILAEQQNRNRRPPLPCTRARGRNVEERETGSSAYFPPTPSSRPPLVYPQIEGEPAPALLIVLPDSARHSVRGCG